MHFSLLQSLRGLQAPTEAQQSRASSVWVSGVNSVWIWTQIVKCKA